MIDAIRDHPAIISSLISDMVLHTKLTWCCIPEASEGPYSKTCAGAEIQIIWRVRGEHGMVMRPQVTPCSEGKLLAIFMPPNGPIHVSNWSRMWWHCRGTAVVAFECDTFSSPDFDGYCQANCICGCRFGKRASRSGHTYRTGRVFMHSSCRNALCKGTWYAIAPMVSQLQ